MRPARVGPVTAARPTVAASLRRQGHRDAGVVDGDHDEQRLRHLEPVPRTTQASIWMRIELRPVPTTSV